MNKKIFNGKVVIYLFAVLFLFLATEFILSLNFNQEHLTQNHFIPSITKYYSEALVHHSQSAAKISWHIVFGMTLLVLGLFQLNDKFRVKHRQLHRVMGVCYMVLGALTAGLGLILSGGVLGGVVTQVAVIGFAFFWYFTAYKSIHYVWLGQYRLHRRWTARNYFAVLATGMVRPALFIMDVVVPGLSPAELYQIANWLGLVLALVLSQWYVDER
ncbi:MAG: DUF2306 domain-containing protein [Bdellovibrionales bacterium]